MKPGTPAREHTVASLDVPLGARLLGCRNCRVGDRTWHPELGLVYCSECPVTRSRETGRLHRAYPPQPPSRVER